MKSASWPSVNGLSHVYLGGIFSRQQLYYRKESPLKLFSNWTAGYLYNTNTHVSRALVTGDYIALLSPGHLMSIWHCDTLTPLSLHDLNTIFPLCFPSNSAQLPISQTIEGLAVVPMRDWVRFRLQTRHRRHNSHSRRAVSWLRAPCTLYAVKNRRRHWRKLSFYPHSKGLFGRKHTFSKYYQMLLSKVASFFL